jgi:branched-subunit amino acid transport protein
MTHVWTVLALGLGTFLLRAAGLLMQDFRIPPAWERAWRFVALALLAALIVTSLNVRPAAEVGMRATSIAAAVLVTFYSRRTWACIASGMLVYLALQAL